MTQAKHQETRSLGSATRTYDLASSTAVDTEYFASWYQ